MYTNDISLHRPEGHLQRDIQCSKSYFLRDHSAILAISCTAAASAVAVTLPDGAATVAGVTVEAVAAAASAALAGVMVAAEAGGFLDPATCDWCC
jgi:hypothetical protein